MRALGKALLAFASPKGALTWARTFDEGEVSEVIPALPKPRRAYARWILAVVTALRRGWRSRGSAA